LLKLYLTLDEYWVSYNAAMNLLTRYTIKHLGASFYPIFLALFVIASVIFFIQISAQTSYLKVTFGEILQLYFYFVPEVLMYTLPAAFFAGGVIALSKLSFDLEMIVLFALGANLRHIIKGLFLIASILTITLLLIGLWLKPKAMLKTKEMIYQKEDTSSLNIQASEFGQRFGEWMLFVGASQEGKRYNDIVLFSSDQDTDTFIRANEAAIKQIEGNFQLSLDNGQVYRIGVESVDQVKFQSMRVNEEASISKLYYEDIIEFWRWWMFDKKRDYDLAYAVLSALFPMLSMLMIVSLGIINPRFQKNRASFWTITMITIYYTLVYLVAHNYPFIGLAIVPPLWIGFSYWLYRKRIRPIY